jgi:urea transport system substrate-binding protein
MATAPTCPGPDTLDDLLANRLPASAAERVRQHIAGCSACQARLGRTSSQKPTYTFLEPPRGQGELGWLGPYRIRSLLGEGGMAFVFEAEDTVLHRSVAIKVLKPEISDESTRRRFVREAQALAALPHDHVVTVFAVEEIDGTVAMLMEHLQGETLQERLDRDHWLAVPEALAFTREAAEGLALVHAKGLVHRDIKPSNLWLENNLTGQFKRVKLIDFGIAREVDQESLLTRMNVVIGTPQYMAPEQALGLPVDARTDLYSLGCVLFRMVTGSTPYARDGEDPKQVLQAVVEGENLASVGQTAPHLPPRVADLIRQLLSRDPAQRPPSAEMLIEQLRRLEDPATEAATIAPTTRSTGPRRRPGRLGLYLGAAAIFVTLVIAAMAAYHKLLPPNGKDEAERESGSGAAVTPSGQPVKVGVLHSSTGTFSIHERPIIKATRLAIKEINAAGGVLGQPIEPVLADGESQEKVFASKAAELIEKNEVAVLFGCWTSSSRKRVFEVCARHDRLLFYPASCEGLEVEPSVVYLGGTPNQTVIPLVQWSYSQKRKRRFFLIGSEYVYSYAANAILEHEIHSLGGKVVGKRYVLLGENEFADVVREIKESKADIILCSIDGQSNVSFCQSLRAGGIRPEGSPEKGKTTLPTVWFSIGESELALFKIADMKGDYSVGCYFDSVPGESNHQFLERFRQAYGAEDRVNDAMETAYFGVYAWKKAVEKAGSFDTQQVRAALRGLTVDAPEGPIRIDGETQHTWRKARVGQLEVVASVPHFEIVYASPSLVKPEPFPDWRTEAQWKSFLLELYKGWGNHWEKHK